VIEHTGRLLGWLRTRQSFDGPCDVSALIRVPHEGVSYRRGAVYYGIRGSGVDGADYSLSAQASPRTGRFSLQLSPRMGASPTFFYRHGNTARPWPKTVYSADRFPDVSPVWDADFRMEVEAANAEIPLLGDTWFEVRIVHDDAGVRIYTDGLLVAERPGPASVQGATGLLLAGKTRVAALTVRRSPRRSTPFHPVALDRLCNATAVGDGSEAVVDPASLPPPGGTVAVGDVPFVFPSRREGADHVDIGASLFRYRRTIGGITARQTWPDPGMIDGGRLSLNVPNRPYARLWVIGMSDGDDFSVPIVTVRFFRPFAGFCVDREATMPGLTVESDSAATACLPVTLDNGKTANLWLVPIDLDSVAIASSFREENVLSVELTKQVHDFRAFPDPMSYGRFQGGPPSGVHLFAMTFEEAPLHMVASGNRTGNAYLDPEKPVWQVNIENLRPGSVDAEVRLQVTDPYGQTSFATNRTVPVMSGAPVRVDVAIPSSVYGLHRVRTEVLLAGPSPSSFVQEGTFIQLPDDTRRASVRDSRWGLPNFAGGHLTNPDMDESHYLHRAAGSRMTRGSASKYSGRRRWEVFPRPMHLFRGPEKWAYEDPYDPEAYEAFGEQIGRHVADLLKQHPDLQYVTLFAETKISMLYAAKTLPQYLGEPEHVLDEQEEMEFRARWITAEAATKGIRKHAPTVKIVFGWCGSLFSVPFMERGYPKADMDGIGLDMPQFERMPEMPIRSVTPSRLWMLQEAMRRYGYEDVPLIHCESYFPTSHRLALGHRGAADNIVRTSVLSMALGTDRFLGCVSLYDCADYWGTQHYGSIGIVSRRPEYNPKHGFAAYATMTRMLDVVEFGGYVPTDSLSSYCVRFKASPYVHCLWTIRGKRDATLKFAGAEDVTVIDESGNKTMHTLVDGMTMVGLSPTPIWIQSGQPIETAQVGVPAYTNAPGPHSRQLDSLEGPWTYSPEPYARYASNHWDIMRVPGTMVSESVDSAERQSKVWRITLQEPEKERKLAAWYGVFSPAKPIELPGKANGLGVWINGKSSWGRIIYELEDANGEIWQSVGTKDSWNCDDIHSWSSFNFDGWRYVEFPLPGNLPYDNYREKDNVWWNNSAEGIVDLPVKLTKIIIEQRTHSIYVNECLTVPDRSVELHNLVAVYADEKSMTDAPVSLQRAVAGRLSFRDRAGAALANPIVALQQGGAAEPPVIAKVAPPAVQYDGTRVVVTIQPVEGAAEYRVYVAAYEDGRGSKVLASGTEPEILVKSLRPEVPLYLFVTTVDQDKKESKPSAARRVVLKDEFPMK